MGLDDVNATWQGPRWQKLDRHGTVRLGAHGATSEQVTNSVAVVFIRAQYLADVRHAAPAIAHASRLNDDVYGGRKLCSQRMKWKIDATRQGQCFEPIQGVARVCGVDSGQAAAVAAGHGLNEIESFASADFT